MLSITDLKKDTIIQLVGVPYKVVEYSQKQMGRGGSIVNTKLKNLLDGSVLQKTFKGSEKINEADVTNSKVQFLYASDNELYFMDQENYEQFAIDKTMLGKSYKILKEGQTATAQWFNGNVINIELPTKIALKVIQAPEVIKGDTQSTVMKNATLETQAEVQVPIFIKTGEEIIIDSRTLSYVERSKN